MKTAFWSLLTLCSLAPVYGQTVNVIFRGKVVMEDGSAPGKSVGIQRTCTDSAGTAPGPLTNKEGIYTWRMEVDYMRTRRCYIVATLGGYESTQVEISNVNPATGVNVDLAPIKLTLKGGDPYQLGGEDKDIPGGKGRAEWGTAMKAINGNDIPGAIVALKAATAANPKFALAWHDLGVLSEFQRSVPEALDAYTKAIEANPKMLAPYVTRTRLLVKEKNWSEVLKSSDPALALDKDHLFSELYVHRAVAQYNLKDLAAAEASAKEAMNPKGKRTTARAEYVLGRVLEAKGDMDGAKQHMAKYLELVPSAEDALVIKGHIDGIGKPGAPEPELELMNR
jgi:tetratricopeptide (TPR) repeat protein